MRTKKKIRKLRDKKEKLLKELRKNCDVICGSLVYIERRCGTSKKYGAYFLSRQEKGKTILTYITKDKVKEIRDKVERHKKTKKILKEISKINLKIFKEEKGGK